MNTEPLISAETKLPELTFRAIIIAIVLAIVLGAANAYLALKIGTTIAASIPASILAIGILRFFKNHNVLECNIIQTAASAGEGVAAAISFVLPAMIFIHAWQSFSYLETFIITTIGGLLGVCFSVPLRKILLNLPDLKFPEGTAIGNVLKASSQSGKQLSLLVKGCSAGALISLAQTGFKIISSDWQLWAINGRTIYGFAFGFTPATLAAGFIVGIQVAVSLMVGILINWLILLPIISSHMILSPGTAYDMAMSLWSSDLRFIGVGTMLVGGIWTIIRLANPLIKGLKTSFKLLQQQKAQQLKVLRTEADIPLPGVLFGILAMIVLAFIFIYYHFQQLDILTAKSALIGFTFFSSIFILIIGFILSTVCGYFTGLIGSTNNPISGILLMSIILLGLIYFIFFHAFHLGGGIAGEINKLIPMIVIITAIIATSCSISNENLQDLKAGQMIGATPWKQQFMLILGVVFSALIMAPVLNLLYQAYGIAGSFPHPGMNPAHMLPAPQASLIAAVSSGVITLHLKWNMIITGIIVGFIIIAIDEILKKRSLRLPALAVGLGMYLPMEINIPIIIGGVINQLVKRKQQKQNLPLEKREESSQKGLLLASGLVAGGAIMGVLLAIPFVIAGNSDALTIMPAFLTPIAIFLGFVSLFGLGYWLYRQ